MRRYLLKGRRPPWGDYGDILVNGLASRRDDGALLVQRAGPFVRPITFPQRSAFVVTDEFRARLARSGLDGLRFREVVKEHIVSIPWHLWDREADEPASYPPDGEPENYLLRRRHDRETSDALGRLWELTPGEAGSAADFPTSVRSRSPSAL
jgi:hypothetical protein